MLGIRLFSLITLVMALSSPNVTWAKRKYGALESHDGYVASVEEEKDKNRAIVLEKADLIKKMNHNLSVMQSIEAPSFS